MNQAFPRYARRFAANGADFLTIQANDGWLGTSAGPFQHFAQAKLRAIENRIPIVRGGILGFLAIFFQLERLLVRHY